ncbi:hypothetical protein TELCIR_07426 [Teladorsagia circumcincta]|uniref:Uncharacterized protein n=1 Tax=Teladorsagia circumcincta TaxID=45464 RepID=A0A2G9ULV3_TELCI|nr:hypothetical protein TELCIR_07426 [Teladorsagia circumcincta]
MQSKVGVAFQNPFSVFREVWQERQRSLRMLYLGVVNIRRARKPFFAAKKLDRSQLAALS